MTRQFKDRAVATLKAQLVRIPRVSELLGQYRDYRRLIQNREPYLVQLIGALERRLSEPSNKPAIEKKVSRVTECFPVLKERVVREIERGASPEFMHMVHVNQRQPKLLQGGWRRLSIKELSELEFWVKMLREFPEDYGQFLRGKQRKYLSGLNAMDAALEYGPLVSEDQLHDAEVVVDIGGGPWGALESVPGGRLKICVDLLSDYYQIYPIENYGTHYFSSPAEDMPLGDASVDFLFCINALDHCSRPARVVREIRRVLKPGGRALLSFYVYSRLGDPSEPHRLTPAWAWRQLHRSFDIRRFEVVSNRRYRGMEHDICRCLVERLRG